MRSRTAVFAALTALLGLSAAPAVAETTLRLVAGTPVNLVWNTPLTELIERVNARGEGEVRIELIGGPEAVPGAEQFRALSGGLVDLHFGPNQYFQGDIPASQAFNASNRSAMDLRADGAFDLINEHYVPQGIRYLGYYGSGYQFLLLLREAPPEGGEFGRDFSDLRLRGTGTYKAFYDALGVTLRDVAVPEVFTALERGAVDGIGWVTLAATDLGYQKFLGARIEPVFWQGDLGLSVNEESWQALSDAARAILTEEIAKSEAEAHAFFMEKSAAEEAAFDAAGTRTVTLPPAGAAAYLAAAYDSRWSEIEGRMDPADASALRDVFYRP